MPQHDQLHRYLFENFAVRGELVTVSETLQQILDNHAYPQPVILPSSCRATAQ